jgi:hypothetical protein
VLLTVSGVGSTETHQRSNRQYFYQPRMIIISSSHRILILRIEIKQILPSAYYLPAGTNVDEAGGDPLVLLYRGASIIAVCRLADRMDGRRSAGSGRDGCFPFNHECAPGKATSF